MNCTIALDRDKIVLTSEDTITPELGSWLLRILTRFLDRQASAELALEAQAVLNESLSLAKETGKIFEHQGVWCMSGATWSATKTPTP